MILRPALLALALAGCATTPVPGDPSDGIARAGLNQRVYVDGPYVTPLAVVEDIAADNNWAFERSGEDEVTIVSKGDWTDYQLSFTWMGEIEALHLACAFDMKIPPARRPEAQRLIAAINEQLWVGHFDLWTHTGMLMHRQALVLPNGLSATTAQCESMLVGAIHFT